MLGPAATRLGRLAEILTPSAAACVVAAEGVTLAETDDTSDDRTGRIQAMCRRGCSTASCTAMVHSDTARLCRPWLIVH
jgi:hypothetical protein